MKNVIYASSNPGKIQEVSDHLGAFGITVKRMTDFGIPDFEVPETGTSLGENALLKVNAYLKALREKEDLRGQMFIVLSDDTGMEIDMLGGEPGIHVRRWRDHVTRMTDQEVVDLTLSRMQHLHGDDRGAQFRTILAVGILNTDGTVSEKIETFEGTLRGRILEAPEGVKVEGFPMHPLFFIDEWGMNFSRAHVLPQSENQKFPSHRERAVNAAIPFLLQELK